MTPPLGVSIDVLKALCADPRVGAPLLEVADPEAAKMLRSMDVDQLRNLCDQHKIGPPQSMLRTHGQNYPRGRDNFDWTGGVGAEPLDLDTPEPWIAALLQPLVTTAQVCEYIVLRDTESRREAYIDRLRRQHWCASHSAGGSGAGRRCGVGPATHFVSHAWSYPFNDVVSALSSFTGQDFFWLDIAVLNQHDVREHPLPQDYWSTTFRTMIQEIGFTVLVLSPWDNPEPMQRSWILWEVACTHMSSDADVKRNSGATIKGSSPVSSPASQYRRLEEDIGECSFTIALPPRERAAFFQALRNSESVRGMLHKVFSSIDARTATASNKLDQQRIAAAIEAMDGGFSLLNTAVMKAMRKWVQVQGAELVSAMTHAVHCDSNAGRRSPAEFGALRNLTAEMGARGSTILSDMALSEGLMSEFADADAKGGSSIAGMKQVALADVVHNYAVLLKDLGADIESLEYYKIGMALREEHLGPHHVATLNSKHCIATMLRKAGGARNLGEAQSLAREVLIGKVKTLGPQHKDTLRTLHGLATIVRESIVVDDLQSADKALRKVARRRVREAERLFERALAGRIAVLGRSNPDMLRTAVNLAQTLELKPPRNVDAFGGRPLGVSAERAEALYRHAHQHEVQVLGYRHTKTLKTARLLGLLLQRKARALHHAAFRKERELHYASEAGIAGRTERRHSSDIIGTRTTSMAMVHAEAGRAESQALEMQRTAFITLMEQFGPHNPSTFESMCCVARALRDRGDRLCCQVAGVAQLDAIDRQKREILGFGLVGSSSIDCLYDVDEQESESDAESEGKDDDVLEYWAELKAEAKDLDEATSRRSFRSENRISFKEAKEVALNVFEPEAGAPGPSDAHRQSRARGPLRSSIDGMSQKDIWLLASEAYFDSLAIWADGGTSQIAHIEAVLKGVSLKDTMCRRHLIYCRRRAKFCRAQAACCATKFEASFAAGSLGLGFAATCDGTFRVEDVSGSAEKLGVQAGDKIVAIEDTAVQGLSKAELIGVIQAHGRPLRVAFTR